MRVIGVEPAKAAAAKRVTLPDHLVRSLVNALDVSERVGKPADRLPQPLFQQPARVHDLCFEFLRAQVGQAAVKGSVRSNGMTGGQQGLRLRPRHQIHFRWERPSDSTVEHVPGHSFVLAWYGHIHQPRAQKKNRFDIAAVEKTAGYSPAYSEGVPEDSFPI